MAVLWREQKRPDEAAYYSAKALRLLEGLTREHPDALYFARLLGVCYTNQGFLAVKKRDAREALDRYDRAVQVLEPAYRKVWRASPIRENLAQAYGGRADALGYLGRNRESLPDWDRFLELYEGPKRDSRRSERAVKRALAGDHAGAAAEAQALATAVQANKVVLFNAACAWAQAAAAARRDPQLAAAEQDRRAEDYAARALEVLARLRESRFLTRKLLADRDLDPLRNRPAFRRLLDEVR
jgi:hypothetical protein